MRVVLFSRSQALSKTLTVDELIYLKGQFALLEPNKNGCITLENIKTVSYLCVIYIVFLRNCSSTFCREMQTQHLLFSFQALMKNATDVMKESRVQDLLVSVLHYCLDLKLVYLTLFAYFLH